MTRPVRMDIDAKTGAIQMIELTDDEIASMKAFADEVAAKETEQNSQAEVE